MDDIATELSVSKRTLYEQFGNRESFIHQCLVHKHLKREVEHQHIEASNLIDAFIQVIEQWGEELNNDIRFMQDLNRYYPTLHQRLIVEHAEQETKKLIFALNTGIEQGYIMPNINPTVSVKMLRVLIHKLFTSESYYYQEDITLPDTLKYIILYFLRGIATEQGRIDIDQYLQK